MLAQPGFIYGQARLQARHGLRVQAAQWQVLEGSRTAGQYLALLHTGALAAWVEGLDTADDAHRIERHLRLQWQRHVDAVASWQPLAWRPALRWFGMLAALPLKEAPTTSAMPAVSAAITTPTANMASVAIAHWQGEWQRRLPTRGADPALQALLLQVAGWLLPRLTNPQGARAVAAPAARMALLRLFRRHPASAVAVCAQLALDALDLERLRGGLVQRLLFEAPPVAAAAVATVAAVAA